VSKALADPIQRGVFVKNETLHTIERSGTEQRIRAKTAWNADTLRGDYGDLIIFDEYQLMDETAWSEVGAPMLIDNDGDAVFVYTPASLQSRSTTKARDPLHAAKLWKKVAEDPRWERFHFTSYDNPHLAKIAIDAIKFDMSPTAFKQEIMAEDIEEVPGALWTADMIDKHRLLAYPKHALSEIVIGVDPSGSDNPQADECGIVVAGRDEARHGYVLEDVSGHYTPIAWAQAVIGAYDRWNANRIIVESNFGGQLVKSNIEAVDASPTIDTVSASRGKYVRAEPIATRYSKGEVHHVGTFTQLEEELLQWAPGSSHSPNRLDALVWALTHLLGVSHKSGLMKYVESINRQKAPGLRRNI